MNTETIAVHDSESVKKLQDRLVMVPDTYSDFVSGIMHYSLKKSERMNVVMEYLEKHPDAMSSDIIKFVSDQPDFMEI